MLFFLKYGKFIFLICFFLLVQKNICHAQYGINDTIITQAIIFNGEKISLQTLDTVGVSARYTHAAYMAMLANLAAWTRLRNAVYVTYPYAMRAGAILNDIKLKLQNITDEEERKKYIKSREKELKKEFTDPLTNLSIYQGKVLMKLINRETGNNCYEIIKEYKGGGMARLYQTVAFFFSTSLKQDYDVIGNESALEKIVLEVRRMYGLNS